MIFTSLYYHIYDFDNLCSCCDNLEAKKAPGVNGVIKEQYGEDLEDMKLPEIGELVTSSRALELCEHFTLDYLAARIEETPEKFKDWKFDGCSCLPDEVLGLFTGCDWRGRSVRTFLFLGFRPKRIIFCKTRRVIP